MLEQRVHYIGGRWQPSNGQDTIAVVNAATEEVMGSIPAGNAEDADKAVRAAREAFASWSTTSVHERAGYLKKAAEGLQLRQTEIATIVSQEVGMPFAYSNVVQVGLPVQSFVSIADVALGFPFERQVYNSLVVREPIGVVVAITPWNYPLHQIAAKVAPALAAGCTVVLKPSEVAPLNAYVLAEVLDSIGLRQFCPFYRNRTEAKVRWRFTTGDARIKLEKLYPVLEYPEPHDPRPPANLSKLD